MISSEQAYDMLKRIIFKIRIEQNKENKWLWGTGFFISSKGYALTAYHCLPSDVVKAQKGKIDIFYNNRLMKLDCLLEMSLPEPEDIAVLKLSDSRSLAIDPLPLGYFDTSATFQERNKFWKGKKVCIAGFPLGEFGQVETIVPGMVAESQPIVEEDIKSSQGSGPDITGKVEWLRMLGDFADSLPGMSGAPVLDLESGTIAAVQNQYVPERCDFIYGTEIGWLLKRVPEFKSIPEKLIEITPPQKPDPGRLLSGKKAEKRYRERIMAEHQHVHVFGRARPLELEKIYISLRVGDYVPAEEKPDEDSRQSDKAGGTQPFGVVEATEALKLKPPRLAVLGDPGSGKTTLLRHLALRVARKDLDLGDWAREIMLPGAACKLDRVQQKLHGFKAARPGLIAGIVARSLRPVVALLNWLRDRLTLFPIPFYLTLNDLARSSDDLEKNLVRHLEKSRFANPADFLSRKLENGECLILLDALDEVMEGAAIHRVAADIAAFANTYERVPVVVTCRIATFEEQDPRKILRGFYRLEVQKFEVKEVERFIRAWFRNPPWKRKSRADGLLKSLERSASMWRLAGNPLLLTLICLLYERDLRLPDRRVELYQRCADELLEKIDFEKGLDVLARFPAEKKRKALQELAYHFHDKRMPMFKRKDLLDAMGTTMVALGYEASLKDDFLQELMERSGLIRQQSKTSYIFAHFTFQEFFTAEYIYGEGHGDRLLSCLGEPWWREVILLYVGLQPDSAVLLSRLREHDVLLAADALADALDSGTDAFRQLSAEIIGELKRLIENDPSRRQEAADRIVGITKWGAEDYLVQKVKTEGQPAISLTAVLALDRAGDRTVLAGLCDPLGPMLRLLTGHLGKVDGKIDERILPLLDRLGLPLVLVKEGEFLMGDERQKLHLEHYWIGKFPVTNALYQRFSDETGYKPNGGWPKEFQPGKENHPAVFINFFDALEFCKWSGTTLPSEAEWEKAARGTDGRKYPWGEQWDPARCNLTDRGTTPVDAHPSGVSPYGCLDMAGNVWEWTRSLDKKYPYDPNDGRENLEDKKGRRVLRGGAFDGGAGGVRCAGRGYSGPDGAGGDLGFRVVLSPFLSGS